MVRIKGHEITPIKTTNSFDRKTIQYKNKIVTNLKKIGICEDDIEVPLERFGIKNVPSKATFWLGDHKLFYSYSRSKSFVDNLYMVQKLIELEVEELLKGNKSEQEFCQAFTEEDNIETERKEARELIGVAQNCTDIQEINQKYKILAKQSHPDMPNGNITTFQTLNKAHKILKRELE
jgi:hypothetical protein